MKGQLAEQVLQLERTRMTSEDLRGERDRLGTDVIEPAWTILRATRRDIREHCLASGNPDPHLDASIMALARVSIRLQYAENYLAGNASSYES